MTNPPAHIDNSVYFDAYSAIWYSAHSYIRESIDGLIGSSKREHVFKTVLGPVDAAVSDFVADSIFAHIRRVN